MKKNDPLHAYREKRDFRWTSEQSGQGDRLLVKMNDSEVQKAA